MLRRIRNLQDVVNWGLCTGCGACAYACDKHAVSLVNVQSVGIRPTFANDCGSCISCLSFCPGYSVDSQLATAVAGSSRTDEEFGSALEIWEGYASDAEIRYQGSSGGVLSALALYCLEREEMGFVLHTAADEAKPWLNKTVQSRTRAELLSRAGSRYAPASPCDALATIEGSASACVFIGKPCDTTAVMALARQRPALNQRLGLVLTFFCAGTPSTDGTVDLLQRVDVKRREVEQLRYRGDGWPGGFEVTSNQGQQKDFIPYDQAWGVLTKYVPLRCHLCPDGLGRVADISCGDAWEQHDPTVKNPGVSIILVRTERGRHILRRAAEAGYVHLTASTAESVFAAQPNLLSRRRELFGRLLALKVFLIPIPKFRNFSVFRSWLRLPLSRKLRTIAGTLRRTVPRGWWKRRSRVVRDAEVSASHVPMPDAQSEMQKTTCLD
jgi:coenzyme F420 hydrogenase subunit beta